MDDLQLETAFHARGADEPSGRLLARINASSQKAARRNCDGGFWLFGIAATLIGILSGGLWSGVPAVIAGEMLRTASAAVRVASEVPLPALPAPHPIVLVLLAGLGLLLARVRHPRAGAATAAVLTVVLMTSAIPAVAQDAVPLSDMEQPAIAAESVPADTSVRDLSAMLMLAAVYIAAAAILALGLAGTSGLFVALLPDRTRFAAGGLSARPAAAFGLGLAQVMIFFIIAALCEMLGEFFGAVVGVPLLAAEAVILIWGASIAATSTGARLLEAAGKSGDPRAEVAWGSGVVGLSVLLPFAGWAAAGCLWLAGSGAALGSMFRLHDFRPSA